MAISNLVFDYGKVLVDYNFERLIGTFFQSPAEARRFMQVVCTQAFTDRCDKEDQPFSEIVADMQRQYPAWREQLQHFHDHYLDFVTGEMPGMRSLLSRLKASGFRLYGLTNWCHLVHGLPARYGIFSLLDGMVASSDVHLIKPDAAIYHCLCRKYGLREEECVFADDKAVNVDGAVAAGMHGIVFRDAVQYEADLRRLTEQETEVPGQRCIAEGD